MVGRIRAAHLCAIAALLGVAFGGAEIVWRALAAAAGTAFEAAPFLLFAYAIERHAGRSPLARRCALVVDLAGCGCARRRLPGALSLPAIALTVLSFGPLVAAARIAFAGGLGLVFRRAHVRRERIATANDASSPNDPLDDVASLAACAFLAALAAAALAMVGSALPWPLALGAGLAFGTLAPCATAGIAIAAAFANAEPALCAGILATAGLVTVPKRGARTVRPARRVPAAACALACALAAIVVRGPSGLVTPRLIVAIAFASAVALASAHIMRSRSAHPGFVPALMLAALAVPPHAPSYAADATRLADAFAGERLEFLGLARTERSHTTLTRYAITCCRLDATPVSVRLERASSIASGRWADARGILVTGADGTLVLRAADVRAVPMPPDPFVYR